MSPATDLEAFLLRLLQQSPQGHGATYLPNRLPEKLPFPLPLPEATHVAGTVIGGDPERQSYTVVLDVSLPPHEALVTLRDLLLAEGWTALQQDVPTHGGFEVPLHAAVQNQFFRESPGLTLHVSVLLNDQGMSDVNLLIVPFVAPPRTIRGHERRSILPLLKAPADARAIPGGAGGSNIHQSSHMGIETALDLASLAAHYNQQLERAGWESQDDGESLPLSWSRWRFRDEDGEAWYGLFFAFTLPDYPDRYLVELQAYWSGAHYER